MCFVKYIRSEKDRQPKKAKRNIRVYKVINQNGDGWAYHLWIDDKREKWTRGNHYMELTPFAGMVNGKHDIVIEGNAFHSCKTMKKARVMKSIREVIVEMIIPKGALYYGNTEEYVSSEIIFPEL